MLKIKNLCKRFGSVQALDMVSAVFETERVYAIVGSNGSGKTSLLNVIAGFYEPDSGIVCWDTGRQFHLNRWSAARRARAGLGYAFQEPRAFMDFTVEDNIRLSLLDKESDNLLLTGRLSFQTNDKMQKVQRLLDLASLGAFSGKLTKELSFGQRKVLDLLCLIARECKIILVDEPFAGVDPQNVDVILQLLEERRRMLSMLTLIVSHEIAVVQRIADRAFLMDEGRIICCGAITDVLKSETFRKVYLG